MEPSGEKQPQTADGIKQSPSQRPLSVITQDMLAQAPARETGIDFEKGISFWPRFTLALIAINTAVFIWEAATGALGSKEAIIAAGALERAAVFAGQYWRMASAVFLHASPGHLIANCMVFYVVGMACEHAFGWGKTAAIYAAAGLCGSGLSLAMRPGPSVGASGAIFGVSAAVVVVLYKHQGAFYVRDKRIGFVLMIWAVYQVAAGFFDPYTDNFAHIGGMFGGAVAAALMSSRLGRMGAASGGVDRPAGRM